MKPDIVPPTAQSLIFISKRLSFASFIAYPGAEKLDAIQLVLRTMRVAMGRTRGLVPEDIGCECLLHNCFGGHDYSRPSYILSFLFCQCYEASRNNFQRH